MIKLMPRHSRAFRLCINSTVCCVNEFSDLETALHKIDAMLVKSNGQAFTSHTLHDRPGGFDDGGLLEGLIDHAITLHQIHQFSQLLRRFLAR